VPGSGSAAPSGASPSVDNPTLESFPSSPRWEFWGVMMTLLLGAMIQINAAFHHGIMGQDFLHNASFVIQCAKDFSTALRFDGTNPPLSIIAYALIIRLTQGIHVLEMIGLLNVVVSLLGMVLVYAIVRRLVHRPLLRLSAMVLLTFLPVRLIHGIVLAADAWTVLPFFGLLWIIDHLARTNEFRIQLKWVLALCGLLFISVFIKYTFFSSIAACACLCIQLARRQRWGRLQAVILIATITVIPALTGYIEIKMNGKFAKQWTIQGQMLNVMSPRSMLFLRPADGHILDAPPYNESLHDQAVLPPTQMFNGLSIETAPYELLYANRYSYPALLHLGVFTDINNIFQFDPSDNYFGTRSAKNQARMAVAVKTALPWSAFCFIAVLMFTLIWLYKSVAKPNLFSFRLESLLILSWAWFMNIVVFFPFLDQVYNGGYWLPRLILPAVLGFFIILFYALDQVLDRWKLWGAAGIILAYALFQSAIHISFLWPWGVFPGR
jgi:hypothetical protein